MPLTYVIIPVYKWQKVKEDCRLTSARNVHEAYLKMNRDIEFVPKFDEKNLLGYVRSIILERTMGAGCSLWTNENLLAEQVVRIPFYCRVQRILTKPLSPFFKLPYVPKPNDTIRSWFLFDLYVRDEKNVYDLLANANNIALSQNRKFLYILLQNNNPILPIIKRLKHRVHTFPYYFLAKGSLTPAPTDKIFIDIRDL